MELQDALDKIVNSVAVVTSKRDEEINGCSVAWVSQVNFTPPFVMFSVGKESYTRELIEESKVFAINILSERQVKIAKQFGLQSGRNIDKFSKIDYETKGSGAPILKDCLAYMDCKVYKTMDVGTQTIYIGEVVEADIKNDEKALIYDAETYE